MSDASESWREEKQSAYLYRQMANLEKGNSREVLFRSMEEAADRQASVWFSKMNQGNTKEPEYIPTFRVRMVVSALRALGPRAMLPVLAAMKVRGLSVYTSPAYPHDEKRHRSLTGGGNLRAAVFGVNDGLISNASLIFGIAGATADPDMVLLSGIAGLLAGAFSMSAGEYVSVRSQRELFEYQIHLEKEEIEEYPEEEARELSLIYEARGIPAEEAKEMASKIIADPKRALDTLAREELGLNPDHLGSPWGAALFSFVSFGFGAFIPLLPFLVRIPGALLISSILTGIALLSVGSSLSLFTGRNALWSGVRMLLIGSFAGGVTYLIGHWLGVNLN